MLPDLISLEDAQRTYGGLLPSKKWVEQQSMRGAWPPLYRTGPKSPPHFRRDELEKFLVERMGLGGGE